MIPIVGRRLVRRHRRGWPRESESSVPVVCSLRLWSLSSCGSRGTTYWDEVSVPTPLQKEAATSPFYAAQRFAEEVGIESEWERVLTSVPVDHVIVLSSWHWTLVEARQKRLQEWVEKGGEARGGSLAHRHRR